MNKRTDIEIIIRKSSTTIMSSKNQITFSKNTDSEWIAVFTTAPFTSAMLDELENSQILQVEEYKFEGESGSIKLTEKDFFKKETFTEILTDIIIKHNL